VEVEMARIRVDLESVQVTEGQGAGEGNFELRISVQEGSHNVVWPALNSWSPVDNDGPALTINREVATYDLGNAALMKRFTIDVTEVDKGLNGLDDAGQGTLELALTPTMGPTSESVVINLKRPRGGYQGKVRVTLSAQIA
jgi:hypothetical protein